MSAAADRLALAQIGQSLIALTGERGERRARAMLTRRPATGGAAGFAEIRRAPGWLLQSKEALERLALGAALVAMAPSLAASIDGGWLRALAASAGDDLLDHAIAIADVVPGEGADAVGAEEAPALGFALIRTALPDPLHRYVDWAPGGTSVSSSALASFAIEAADAFIRGRRP